MLTRKWGWKRDLPDIHDLQYFKHPEFELSPVLPPHVDLRAQMSPVEDQGQLGSCVAHAVCGALEYLELLELKHAGLSPEEFGSKFEDISRLFVYWNARYIDGTADHDSGTHIRSAIKSIKSDGICREKLWPYDIKKVFDLPNTLAYKEAEKHKILTSYSINHLSIFAMKQCLANGYPFVFGISVYESMMTSDVTHTGLIPMPQKGENLLGGHALCCVGYDDDKNSFLVRNSWGTGWGIKGYCYIPYNYLTNPGLCADSWTLRRN